MDCGSDWVPSLHLGHTEVEATSPERFACRRKRQTATKGEISAPVVSQDVTGQIAANTETELRVKVDGVPGGPCRTAASSATTAENDSQTDGLTSSIQPASVIKENAVRPEMSEPDVQPMMNKEEELDEWSSSLHHQDPELHIKEEEEEHLTSPGGGIPSFPFTLVTVKRENGEEEHLSSHFYQNKIEDEKPFTSRSTKQREDVEVSNPVVKLVTDRKDADIVETEIKRGNANYEDWQIPLPDYGPENEDNNRCFKETYVPESDEKNDVVGNTKQSFTCPKHTTNQSEKGSSTCLGNKTCPMTKPNVDSELGALIGRKTFDNDVGDQIFIQETLLDIDTKVHTEEAPFDCDVCGKTFSVKGSLNRHMRIHTGQKHFSCGVCCKKFIEKTDLKKHVKVHTGEKPFSCDFCGKKFRQKAHINRHVIIHKGDKPFVCDVCGKTFNVKANLNVHIRIHTGEKQFGCDVCGKTFSIKGNLNAHMRIHKGDKHFGCDICGKTFILKGNLTTHMRIHTGEKHFGCNVCGKTFISKGNLDAHVKIHTGEKRFSCDVCRKKFILKTDLRKHMRVHTGEKPFSCGLCVKTFSQKIHLKTHMITHKDEKPLVVTFVVKHST